MHILVFQIAIIFLFLVVFGEASLSKVLGGGVPDWFRNQFAPSWLSKIAPIPLLWWTIALLELAIAGLFVYSAVLLAMSGAVAARYWMEWGLLGGIFLFGILCFGQRVTFDYAGAANSFFYASLTGMLWYIVHHLPKA